MQHAGASPSMTGLGEVRFRTLVEQRELSMDQAGTVPLLLLRRGGQRWLDNARAKIKYASMQQAASNVVLVTDDVSRVRYQDQGNADLSASADAFKQRQKLRRSPIVLEALDEWWSVSLRRVRRYRPDATSLVWAEYCAVYKAIYADLLGADAYDEAEAEAEAREEWARDCKGGSTMDRAAFLDALFELGDLYTDDVAAATLEAFLQGLLSRVAGRLDAGEVARGAHNGGAAAEGAAMLLSTAAPASPVVVVVPTAGLGGAMPSGSGGGVQRPAASVLPSSEPSSEPSPGEGEQQHSVTRRAQHKPAPSPSPSEADRADADRRPGKPKPAPQHEAFPTGMEDDDGRPPWLYWGQHDWGTLPPLERRLAVTNVLEFAMNTYLRSLAPRSATHASAHEQRTPRQSRQQAGLLRLPMALRAPSCSFHVDSEISSEMHSEMYSPPHSPIHGSIIVSRPFPRRPPPDLCHQRDQRYYQQQQRAHTPDGTHSPAGGRRAAGGHGGRSAALVHLFAALDADGDGRVTRAELRDGFARLGLAASVADIDGLHTFIHPRAAATGELPTRSAETVGFTLAELSASPLAEALTHAQGPLSRASVARSLDHALQLSGGALAEALSAPLLINGRAARPPSAPTSPLDKWARRDASKPRLGTSRGSAERRGSTPSPTGTSSSSAMTSDEPRSGSPRWGSPRSVSPGSRSRGSRSPSSDQPSRPPSSASVADRADEVDDVGERRPSSVSSPTHWSPTASRSPPTCRSRPASPRAAVNASPRGAVNDSPKGAVVYSPCALSAQGGGALAALPDGTRRRGAPQTAGTTTGRPHPTALLSAAQQRASPTQTRGACGACNWPYGANGAEAPGATRSASRGRLSMLQRRGLVHPMPASGPGAPAAARSVPWQAVGQRLEVATADAAGYRQRHHERRLLHEVLISRASAPRVLSPGQMLALADMISPVISPCSGRSRSAPASTAAPGLMTGMRTRSMSAGALRLAAPAPIATGRSRDA